MEADNKGQDSNKLRDSNENPIPTANPLSKPYRNGSCGTPKDEYTPTESENQLNDDLTYICNKLSKENSTRTQGVNPANQPGPPSQQDGHGSDASRGFYYGIKSYLHHFYAPPDKDVLKSGEYVQGDDFKFLAEPQRKSCWVRAGLWIGINLVLLGSIAMVVGYLTPPRQAVVGQFNVYTVLDRWAVNFNYHLMMCQLVGLITFSFGAVVVVCSLIVANYNSAPSPPAYLVMGAYLPSPTPGTPSSTWGIHCIPLSGTLKSVQPQFIRPNY